MTPLLMIALGALAMLVFALILVSGSRAGLVLAVIAVPLAGWLVYTGMRETGGASSGRMRVALVVAIAVAVIAVATLTIASSQAETINRLSNNDALRDHRFERLSIIMRMLHDHWVMGIGFGAFEGVFKGYETIEVLTPFIFNEAHNDWLQFVIEGGVPAVCLLALCLFWLAATGYRKLRAPRKKFDSVGFVALSILGLSGIASAVDYPLRTPIMMLICATAFTLLAISAAEERAGAD